MNKITERFILTYKKLGLNGYRIGKEIPGITKQKISHIENGRCEVSIDIIEAFCKYNEKVNANWIITGKGGMFTKTPEDSLTEKSTMLEEAASTFDELREMDLLQIAKLDSMKIDKLQREMEEVKSLLNNVLAKISSPKEGRV